MFPERPWRLVKILNSQRNLPSVCFAGNDGCIGEDLEVQRLRVFLGQGTFRQARTPSSEAHGRSDVS